ncbi:Son of sevenless [Hibiscus syriacus]|uniref:Son of sevenless n=2 Tax=Hibiscus syriacus TaxID=106335 RepID=A0A6A2YGJ0_HIBSY|nr:Son of sevenless [Hibiscus syriacus]
MAAPPPPPSNIGLRTILSESRRIFRAHTWHFQALSVLFLLPFSFFLSVYPFIYQQNPPIFFYPIRPFISILIYTLILSFFSIFAVGSITHSVFHGFYGQPVKLLSAIKEASTSFFPLISTAFVESLIVSGINLILGLVFFALLKTTQILGFQVHHSSSFLILLCLAYLIILTSISLYLRVNWTFAYVIVVVESSWGIEPLKRSQILVKGMKGVAFKILLFFGFFISINILQSIMISGDSAGDDWKSWDFILNIVATTAFYMVLLLYSLAACTVFYVYSKALQGELAEQFAGEYVSLPFDDGKAPHVVSIV